MNKHVEFILLLQNLCILYYVQLSVLSASIQCQACTVTPEEPDNKLMWSYNDYSICTSCGVGQYEEMDYENSTVADRPETTANLEMRPIKSDSI